MFRKKITKIPFDRKKERPVIRAGICTGEQVAGFKDTDTGHFTEVMLIKNDRDLQEFKTLYGVDKITKEY